MYIEIIYKLILHVTIYYSRDFNSNIVGCTLLPFAHRQERGGGVNVIITGKKNPIERKKKREKRKKGETQGWGEKIWKKRK